MKLLAAYNPKIDVGLAPSTKYAETEGGLFISNIAQAIGVIAGVILLVYLLYGGLRYVTAGGDEKNLKEAQKTINNAIMGIIIVAIAFFLTALFGGILGFDDIFKLEIPGP